MQLHATDIAETYAAAVSSFLDAEPVQRNVLRSVMEQALSGGGGWSAPPGFWWIVDKGAVVAAASWTPPWPLLVSDIPEGAAAHLATAALHRGRRLGVDLPGVTGPAREARAVAEAAARDAGARVEEHHRLIVHELGALVDVPRPPGAARRADAAEAATVAAWMRAFSAETDVPAISSDADATVRAWLARGFTWVWVHDGEPRSTATQYVAGGVARVLAVYTPPEHRGRGYARRLVQEVSAMALRTQGIKGCTLNTDAANTVANAIYRQIGYVPVAEHAQYDLLDSRASGHARAGATHEGRVAGR